MKTLDLTYKKYQKLLYDGDVDDMNYGEWINYEIYHWLPVAKHKYNQDYIKIIVDDDYDNQKKTIKYSDYFDED